MSRYLNPAASSLNSKIAGCQSRYLDSRYLSPAANSQDSRIAGCQPRYLDLGT